MSPKGALVCPVLVLLLLAPVFSEESGGESSDEHDSGGSSSEENRLGALVIWAEQKIGQGGPWFYGPTIISSSLQSLPAGSAGADTDPDELLTLTPPRSIRVVTGNHNQSVVLWSEVAQNIAKTTMEETGRLTSPTRVFVTGTSGRVGGLAVDWLSGNIYWCDASYNSILAATSDGTRRRVLVQTGAYSSPSGLALHPEKGLMFWASQGYPGIGGKVERATMTGQGRTALAHRRLVDPRGLALDYADDRLYWADVITGKIESVTLEGGDRRLLLSVPGTSIKGLAMYQDYLYYTDLVARKVHCVGKSDGREVFAVTARTSARPVGITVYNSTNQIAPANRVSCIHGNHSCAHLCLTTSAGYQCACADGYELQQDNHTCRPVEKPGDCPDQRTLWPVCSDQCQTDGHCSHDRKCCFNGCGHTCAEPDIDPCSSDHNPCVSEARCEDHSWLGAVCICPEGQEGDGRTQGTGCQEPRCPALTSCTKFCPLGFRLDDEGCPICECRGSDKPGQCPTPDDDDDDDTGPCWCHCTSDHHCHGNQKCCSVGCSLQCVDPVTDSGSDSSEDVCSPDDPCVSMATCGDAGCQCEPGYRGDGRQDGSGCTDINECTEDDTLCDDNAICTNTNGSYQCTCRDGFAGNGVTCSDVDECWYGSSDCHDHAHCHNQPGSYFCTCAAGYEGDGRTCEDTDGCLEGICELEAVCTDVPAPGVGAVCTCPPGMDGDGRQDGTGCFEEDGCGMERSPCVDDAWCEDVPAPGVGAVCHCPPGAEGDGRREGSGCSDISTCSSVHNPCVVNATCNDQVSPPVCTCPPGWQGDGRRDGFGCEDEDECADDTSMCEQTCTNTPGSFSCACQQGFVLNDDGRTCQDVDECTVDNGGCQHLCENDYGSFYCECRDGFQLASDRKSCQDMNECQEDHSCSQVCNNTAGSYFCSCWEGFLLDEDGWTCRAENPCSDETAAGCDDMNGWCRSVEEQAVCGCNTGFILTQDGRTCQGIDNDEMNGWCRSVEGQAVCGCNSGFILTQDGRTCQDIDECADFNHCHGNATCINFPGSYTCTCDDGYQGDGNTCSDINECTEDPYICDPLRSTCVNLPGSFRCDCLLGFVLGDGGNVCQDIDECMSDTHNCDQNADCEDREGSYVCRCAVGYTGDGTTCTDIDGCSADHNPCVPEATCADIPAPGVGAVCTCPLGRDGDGYVDGEGCRVVPQCSPDVSPCAPEARCMEPPTPGGQASCACPTGWLGDGRVDGQGCQDINECLFDTHGCTHTCVNTRGSYSCACPEGYLLGEDRRTCVNVNECQDDNGMCAQVCVDTEGSYRCSCHPGYKLEDEFTCTDVNECAEGRDSCHANAECVNNEGSYDCYCRTGFEGDGRTCTDQDECLTADCQQICTNTPGSFMCGCQEGYLLLDDKRSCDNIDECSLDDHGGCRHICRDTEGSYYCECEPGFTLAPDGKSCYRDNIITANQGGNGESAVPSEQTGGAPVPMAVGLSIAAVLLVLLVLAFVKCRPRINQSTAGLQQSLPSVFFKKPLKEPDHIYDNPKFLPEETAINKKSISEKQIHVILPQQPAFPPPPPPPLIGQSSRRTGRRSPAVSPAQPRPAPGSRRAPRKPRVENPYVLDPTRHIQHDRQAVDPPGQGAEVNDYGTFPGQRPEVNNDDTISEHIYETLDHHHVPVSMI
ncbi:uncharacterized protein LOC144883590 [Branchiostoma floridae x Branchiostoma japonicum]